jgi:branched-chain amino acid transport system substrate-binding protein
VSRRSLVSAGLGSALVALALIHARVTSAPIRVGLLSDVAGPYRNVDGPAAKVAVELAVEDIGGSLLGRQLEVIQSDIQNKSDIASACA